VRVPKILGIGKKWGMGRALILLFLGEVGKNVEKWM